MRWRLPGAGNPRGRAVLIPRPYAPSFLPLVHALLAPVPAGESCPEIAEKQEPFPQGGSNRGIRGADGLGGPAPPRPLPPPTPAAARPSADVAAGKDERPGGRLPPKPIWTSCCLLGSSRRRWHE